MLTETAEVSFHDLLGGIGRSDIVGKFHGGDYELESPVKSDERRKVLEFFTEFFNPSQHLRALTLPGQYWYFEHLLNLAHPNNQLVCLERSRTVFNRSVHSIVNCHLDLRRRWKDYGSGGYHYVSTCGQAPSARRHCYLNMSSADYVSMLVTDYCATMEQKKVFNHKFCRRNAIWLDFTSCFCEETETTISHLNFCLDSSPNLKPVVITMMYGRDIGGHEQGRIDHIQKLQPLFQYQNHWTYTGKNGTAMITICGTMK